MTIISPSLLSADFLNLEAEVSIINSSPDTWLHLDVMDGHFVPNLTFGGVVIEKLKKISKVPLDAHFMVTNPEFYLEFSKNWGLHNFTFHWEAAIHHDRLITDLKKIYPSVGISLNPSTSTEVIPDYILAKVDLVLLMSVNPGFGGQSFIPDVLDKARALDKIRRDKNLKFQIQIDGGVTDQNASEIRKSGVDNLVAGSYIFSEPQKRYLDRIEKLRQN